MKCKQCKRQYKAEDSMGSCFGWCQDCWEAACDRSWWKLVNRLFRAGCKTHYAKF